MKELVFIDMLPFDGQQFSLGYKPEEISLFVYVTNDAPLEQQLKNRQLFEECMKNDQEYEFLDVNIQENDKEKIKYIRDHFDNLLEEAEYVVLNFSEINSKEFIQKNPILLSKKIVLNEYLSVSSYDELITLMKEYEGMCDKIYIMLDGNEEYVSLNDCYKTMVTIREQAKEIEKLGLSKMETIMYVYDLVRNRTYLKEDVDEDYTTSRDLSKVLFGNKIVCCGYANIFKAMLSYLNIDCYNVRLSDSLDGGGHERSVIYVNDPKYDIDGVYYFDPTWDSKKDNNTYLYGYKFFARIREYMDRNSKPSYHDEYIPQFYNIYEKVLEIVSSRKYDQLLKYRKSLNNMARTVGEKDLIDVLDLISGNLDRFDPKDLLNRFKKIVDRFDKELTAEVMIKLFNNVRKVEYYMDSDWYPYDPNDIYKVVALSDWDFKEENLSPESKLLKALSMFMDDGKKMVYKDDITDYCMENNIYKDMEQVRLTKILQKVLDQKKK